MNGIIRPEVERYAEEHTTAPPPHLVALAEETRENLSSPQMMTGPVEGRFLEVLVFASGARSVLEIGTFSGYSALSMAAGLPADGRIVTCEVDAEVAEVARRHIAASPYAARIEVRVGPALETVAGLEGPFDLVFIDADKQGYRGYLEAVLPKLSERGVIAIDNTLWSGRVVDDAEPDERTRALVELNDGLRADPRVVCVQLTVRDGITLVRRAPSETT
ncbi:MAG: class I SAM-dependent methyltransferase [Thermoleophilaceae bacterium]|jgi:caffeoyl-CoA O-methyltransferase|nr:class I SAM-dependent methyltransferase [Actinomycetota bacterium]